MEENKNYKNSDGQQGGFSPLKKEKRTIT